MQWLENVDIPNIRESSVLEVVNFVRNSYFDTKKFLMFDDDSESEKKIFRYTLMELIHQIEEIYKINGDSRVAELVDYLIKVYSRSRFNVNIGLNKTSVISRIFSLIDIKK